MSKWGKSLLRWLGSVSCEGSRATSELDRGERETRVSSTDVTSGTDPSAGGIGGGRARFPVGGDVVGAMLRTGPSPAGPRMPSRYKYLLAFTVPATVWTALLAHGAWTFLPLVVYFGLVPALELAMSPSRENLDPVGRERVEADGRWYDALLHAIAPIQLATLALFLVQVREPGLSAIEVAGRISAMGIGCGALGINAGHELGHRKGKLARLFGQLCMLSSRGPGSIKPVDRATKRCEPTRAKVEKASLEVPIG